MIHPLTTHRESGIRVVLDEKNKLESVHHLEIGLTDLPTPPYSVEAAVHAARQGYTGYTPNANPGPRGQDPRVQGLRRARGKAAS